MNVSKAGVDFIKRFEALKTVAYRDGGGIWTIGYGHAIKLPYEMYFKDNPISPEIAENLLKEDLQFVERCIAHHVRIPLTQNQYDAIASFIFNVGCRAFERSTFLYLLNLGNAEKAADQLLRWNKDNKKEVAGLTRRRKNEREMFLYGDYNE